MRTSLIPLQWLAIPVLACAFRMAQAATATGDSVFSDGFEAPILLVPTFLAATSNCQAASAPTPPQDTPIRVCYRLINLTTSRTFTHQHIVDNLLGVTYDHDLTLAPGANIVVESDLAPFPVSDSAVHFVDWTASAGASIGRDSQLQFIGYDPNIHLRALIVPSVSACPQGIVDTQNGAPFSSGLTAVTVAPGTPLAGCYRAKNEGGTLLNRHRLVDDALGNLLDVTATTLGQGSIYSVSRSLNTAATTTFGGTWHAGFDADDITRSSAHATVTVVANPACSGIATSSTIDYASSFSPLASSGMRLDFNVSATPLHTGQTTTITASGHMVSLPDFFGAALFGPREDTRITVAVPPGIDMTQAIAIVATLNGSVPLTPTIDAVARTIVLNTGPVSGPPASIELAITAKPDGSANPIVFRAPDLELDLDFLNSVLALGATPDPNAPAVLTAPLCSS